MDLPVNYDEIDQPERRKVREEYIKRQEGKCCHCGQALDQKAEENKEINRNLFPTKFFNHPVHLHHNHDTGMTIGAVHCYCNAVLWQYHGE